MRTITVMITMLLAAVALPAQAQRGGPAAVFVTDVEEQQFSTRIEALGTLEPKERAELRLNAADRVTAVFFDDGQRVVQGKTLLSLAQREQVALVEAADARADEARRQLERVTRLAAENAVSQSELDEARRNASGAEAELRAVQSRQRDRVLVAPFDGVLGFRNVSVGSYVGPGDVVATLIDDSEMRLEFSVPSIFLTAVSPGSQIDAKTDDLPGEIFSGQVTSIDNAIDPVTRAVRVRATLPNPDRILKAGMFMTVDLTARPRMGIAIPEKAIEPRGPSSFVYVVDDSETPPVARRTQVELGLRQGATVEVLSGLDVGERVVTEGLIRVRDNGPLAIKDESMLSPGGSSTGARASAVAGPG
ncbi:MAG: efflux RND transporter periplasmic adaptor subunit [Pseudomonadota bacterium]